MISDPDTQPNAISTSQTVVMMVVASLSLFLFCSLVATVYLIVNKTDAALVAMVSGMAGTSLGSLTALLANTRTQQNPQPPQVP
jgi:uncharacterized protein involved in exopolysaccharide biosynthesis